MNHGSTDKLCCPRSDKIVAFRDLVREPEHPVVIATVVPPPRGASPSDVDATLDALERLLERAAVDAFNLPEVRCDPRAPRDPFVPKLEPRAFARSIRERLGADALVNRATVHTHWANQRAWLRKTWRAYHIKHLVLVGGSSHHIEYPGPAVPEAARRITQELNASCETGFFLGGITIPTRRREPARLIEKSRSGIEFFISQILYESEPIKGMLRDYHRLCLKQHLRPTRVFLSFAPVSSREDVEFLKRWEIVIPDLSERDLLSGWLGTGWRSIELAGEILQDLLDFVQRERLQVPLGLNVEHVRARNFELSGELLARLTGVYRTYYQSDG